MKPKWTAWSDDEYELLVEVYANMLRKEQQGETYHKAAIAQTLADCLGRSRCSVEYMWQNVSHILLQLNRQRIAGYKPRKHCSQRLIATVLRLM